VGATIDVDVNGDGRGDFIAGAPGSDNSAGAVFVYSGIDGSLLFQKNGQQFGDRLGGSVGLQGDVNSDGKADFIIGAPGTNNSQGVTLVYSGSTGSLLYQNGGSATGDRLGGSVGIMGDATADGFAEFIVGAPVAASAIGISYVYSGATGNLLYQRNGTSGGEGFGSSAAGAGDVNADGVPDFIVGAPSADPGGRKDAGSAYVYSGADGALLFQKDGAAAFDYLGSSVAGAGDVDGDGKADFIISAPVASPGGLSYAGSAYVYSGATGLLIFQKDGPVGGQFGYSVAGAGDVDGDGKADFIIGAFLAFPGGRYHAGSAFVYSGATGALLFQKDGAAANDWFGYSVAGAGDVDGDGKADFIISAPVASPGGRKDAGSAYVYSGADGLLLIQKDGAAAFDYLGSSVAGAGDVDGDGVPDFIIAASFADSGVHEEAGSAYLYSGATGLLLFQKDGVSSAEHLGSSVAGAGDVDGNGKADFIIGAPAADPGGLSDAGSAFVYGLPGCVATIGDMNGDGMLTSLDVVLLLNCAFLGEGDCFVCFADVNCDGILTSADVVLELNKVFLHISFPCGP